MLSLNIFSLFLFFFFSLCYVVCRSLTPCARVRVIARACARAVHLRIAREKNVAITCCRPIGVPYVLIPCSLHIGISRVTSRRCRCALADWRLKVTAPAYATRRHTIYHREKKKNRVGDWGRYFAPYIYLSIYCKVTHPVFYY